MVPSPPWSNERKSAPRMLQLLSGFYRSFKTVVEKRHVNTTVSLGGIRFCPPFRVFSPKFGVSSQLALVALEWDAKNRVWCRPEESPHVFVLWRMEKESRILLWKHISPSLHLEELALGGDWDTRCPMDDEEIEILFSRCQLSDLRHLSLQRVSHLSDRSVETLVQAGCGPKLETLSLAGERRHWFKKANFRARNPSPPHTIIGCRYGPPE